MATRVRYLISYDIREPRRLLRVMRRVRQQAIPVQYSVYYAELYAHELNQLVAGLEALIEPKIDDVRIYAIGSLKEAIYIGSMRPIDPDALLTIIQ